MEGFIKNSADHEVLHDVNRFPRPAFLNAAAISALAIDLEACIVFSCVCGKPEAFHDWIACEAGVDCVAFQWYHMACVECNAADDDGGKWFCPMCNESRAANE